jgi:hypothetical protein
LKNGTPNIDFQGEDFRVPIGQGQEAFQAAQCNKVDSSTFQEENWVLKPQNANLAKIF